MVYVVAGIFLFLASVFALLALNRDIKGRPLLNAGNASPSTDIGEGTEHPK